MNNVIQFPQIADTEITIDAEGRFNLNALHRAHLKLNPELHRNSKQPADWLKLEGAKKLIEVISNSEDLGFAPVESRSGRYGGTFAVEQLAVAYANWISPSFYLQVINTFLDYKNGKLKPASPELSRMDILQLAMEAERENQRLTSEVQEMKPKVEFYDRVIEAEDTITIAQVAKIIGTGQHRLFRIMREHSWINRNNEPYQDKITAGLLDVKLSKYYQHPRNGLTRSITTMVTGKGLVKLQMLCREEAA